MRVYLPASRQDLSAVELEPRRIHTVTDELRQALPEDDEETLELVAFLAAADESVAVISERSDAPCRVVIAADVDAVSAPFSDEIETAAMLALPVSWDQVASIHLDEDEAGDEVAAAVGGDDDALDRLGFRELLWYDVSERDTLI